MATKDRILHVFGGLPGCLHDQLVLGASGIMRQIAKGVTVRVDKGYAGTDTRYKDVSVAMPLKRVCRHQLTWLGRAYNHMLSVLRIPVEHHFARLQTFGILSQEYRGMQATHEDIFCVIAGLLNFRASGGFAIG